MKNKMLVNLYHRLIAQRKELKIQCALCAMRGEDDTGPRTELEILQSPTTVAEIEKLVFESYTEKEKES